MVRGYQRGKRRLADQGTQSPREFLVPQNYTASRLDPWSKYTDLFLKWSWRSKVATRWELAIARSSCYLTRPTWLNHLWSFRCILSRKWERTGLKNNARLYLSAILYRAKTTIRIRKFLKSGTQHFHSRSLASPHDERTTSIRLSGVWRLQSCSGCLRRNDSEVTLRL